MLALGSLSALLSPSALGRATLPPPCAGVFMSLRSSAIPTPGSAFLKVFTLRSTHCTDSPPAFSTSLKSSASCAGRSAVGKPGGTTKSVALSAGHGFDRGFVEELGHRPLVATVAARARAVLG